jgi:RNA polymerase-binding transcription factor DksA
MFTAEHHTPGQDVQVPTFDRGSSSQQAAENPLTSSEIEAFRTHLQLVREWIMRGINQIESRPVPRAIAVSVDGAADEDAWHCTLAQQAVANKRLLLNEVMQAFDRIRMNTYGRCVADHSCISRTVLEDMPWARYCSSCASRHG